MSEDYVSKLDEDLRTKLDHLFLMHNDPTWHVVEHFAELRRQVDNDAERLLEEIQTKRQEAKILEDTEKVNAKRMAFIQILDELEKRTGLQLKPVVGSSEVYASLEQRVDTFKDSSDSLDDFEETYVQLVQEVIDATDQLEKRILGEQTILYWPSMIAGCLGGLVYFGDLFLTRKETDLLL